MARGRTDSALLFVGLPVLLAVALALAPGRTTHGRVVAATALAVAFSAAVARSHEEHDPARRHGDAWRDWRRAVRDWCPRWRPYASGAPAVLRLDAGCGPCVAVWRFLARRNPVNLTSAPAKEGQLRAGYTGGDGHAERGGWPPSPVLSSTSTSAGPGWAGPCGCPA